MKLIDKDALVEEIERLIKSPILYKSENVETRISVLEYLLSFLGTLEVKDVDIEKEIIDWWNTHYFSKVYASERYSGHYFKNSTLIEIAKHFFELGLKTKQTTI